MPVIVTRPQEIDRKLHRIILEAKEKGFPNSTVFAAYLNKIKATEFSYQREDETRISKVSIIERFITFAQAIKLLNSNLKPSGTKKSLKDLGAFQNRLSNLVIQYLDSHFSSISDIKKCANILLQEKPPKVPTIKNVHDKLQNSPSLREFKDSVRIISKLRPKAFMLKSRPVFIIDGILKG